MILKNLESNVNALVRENDIDFHIVNSTSDLKLADLAHSDAILFRTDRVSQIKLEIEKIRRADNPNLYLKPIFVSSRRLQSKLNNEVDGVVEGSDLDSIEEKTKEILKLIKEVNPAPIAKEVAFNDRVLLKMMQYMYTRQLDLKPERSRTSLIGYHYPFVRQLLPDFELATFLDKVEIASQKNWFSTKLQDRVNLCKTCSSSYLHFVETCHRCSSIDIEAEHLIHHFRCAYIGPQSDFEQEDILVCPKCDKALRHIGVDYDKPSEILTCNSCNHQAQQSNIRATCIDCGEDNELVKLHTREVKELKLSGEGIDVAKKANVFHLVKEEEEVVSHKYEVQSHVFDLLRSQEIKKTKALKNKSYNIKIDFSSIVLQYLTPREKIIFSNEFRGIIGTYLDDVDLMTMRSNSSYEILLSGKTIQYVEDMNATLEYNVSKIIDDNFDDPDHQLAVNFQVLDKTFQA